MVMKVSTTQRVYDPILKRTVVRSVERAATPAEEEMALRDKAEHEASMAQEAAIEAAIGYRKRRAEEYIKQFSQEGTFATSVGDAIDALMSEVEALRAGRGRSKRFSELLTKRDRIKSENPSP